MKTSLHVGWILAVWLLAPLSSVRGNGGGYELRQDLDGSLDLFTPEGTEQVQIVREDLVITLGAKYAEVDVSYRMQNDGPARQVTIGFPVEDGKETYPFDGEPEEATPKPTEWKGCENYTLEFDGKPLKATAVGEPPASASIDTRRENLLGWMVSTLPFKKDGAHSVRIRFRSQYAGSETWVSDDHISAAKTLRYRLSTAAVWRGAIGSGTVTVKKASAGLPDPVIKAPAGKFQRNGDAWGWEFADLEPTLADDLLIEAAPRSGHFGNYDHQNDTVSRYKFIGEEGKERWSLEHQQCKITASSTLPPQGQHRYDASHLLSGHWTETVWAEGSGGDGAGESLTLTLTTPRPVSAINLWGGYYGKRDDLTLWQANNRPARVRITRDGKHPVEADLSDTREWQHIRLTGPFTPVKTLKIEFLKVYRGATYNDLCLSALSLDSPLQKKPAIQGAR